MTGIDHVAVVIPAHDEERLIGPCLRSVGRALSHPALDGVVTWVVVVADLCADRTVEGARQALARGRRVMAGAVLEVGYLNVGRARATGTAAALTRWAAIDPATVWLASTDADSTVPPAWLARQLRAARLGYAGVAGVVNVHSFPGQQVAVPARFRATYALPEHGRHPHVHGCNLGVRADAYLEAGGWPPIELAEDHGLWRALRSHGRPVLADRWLEVVTSGRRASRARGGFADTLASLGAAS